MEDLVAWAENLRHDQASEREAAWTALSTLPPEALPAIAERLEYTQRQIVPEEDGYDALRFFRHEVGSLRADDQVDIAPGVLPVLVQRRTTEVARVAERLAYLRALERMAMSDEGNVEAQRRIADVFALTNRMWRWEQRRIVERMGARILPGLLLARRHPDAGVRRWSRWAVDELEVREPARAIQAVEGHPPTLAATMEAFAEVRELDAMQVVISFVDHDDPQVRDAARRTMRSFGRNGIWQLRRAMVNQLDEQPDTSWGWRRTMEHLYEALDERRLAPVNAELEAGLEAFASGDLETMRTHFDAVLRDAPTHPQRARMAEGYAALGNLRRAIRLSPEEAATWRAALLVQEAEADREAGFFDADAYREAARLDPSNEAAREVVRELLDEEVAELTDAPEEPAAVADTARRWTSAALLGIALFGLVMWQRRRLTFALRALGERLKPSEAPSRRPAEPMSAEAAEPSEAESAAALLFGSGAPPLEHADDEGPRLGEDEPRTASAALHFGPSEVAPDGPDAATAAALLFGPSEEGPPNARDTEARDAAALPRGSEEVAPSDPDDADATALLFEPSEEVAPSDPDDADAAALLFEPSEEVAPSDPDAAALVFGFDDPAVVDDNPEAWRLSEPTEATLADAPAPWVRTESSAGTLGAPDDTLPG